MSDGYWYNGVHYTGPVPKPGEPAGNYAPAGGSYDRFGRWHDTNFTGDRKKLEAGLAKRRRAIAEQNAREWLDAAAKNQGGGPGGGLGPGGGGGGGFGGGGGGGPRIDFNGQINAQYDRQLALLSKLVGDAKIDITNVGKETGQKIAAGGKDAKKQGAAINADIKALYAQQMAQSQADLSPLLKDLAGQGANDAAVRAAAKQQGSEVKGEGARQRALSARLQQVLAGDFASRGAGVEQVTAGTKQQLSAKDAMLRAQIEDQRQQALAQAAMAALSGGGGGGRGGGRGGGGGSSSSLFTPGTAASFLEATGNQPIDFQQLIGNLDPKNYGVDNFNANEIASLNQFANSLANGAPLQGQINSFQQWMAQKKYNDNYHPQAILDFLSSVGQYQAQHRPLDPRQILALTQIPK